MLRLYGNSIAPNVVRVAMLAREKGIVLERTDPSAIEDYVTINPLGQVPALELDDGTVITESLVISRYLDDISGPERLFGDSSEERAQIGMWERRAEALLFNPGVEYGHHVHPFFRDHMRQHPEWAGDLIPKAQRMSDLAAQQLASTAFLAGSRFSVADITLYLGWFFLDAYGAVPWNGSDGAQDWRKRMEMRDCLAELGPLKAIFGRSPATQK